MSGFVSFVSSGPGDPELLTLKAVGRLKKADAILFDDLSSGPVLKYIDPSADLVAVGKRAGRASPSQSHVSRLLVEYAQGGQHVVRLKSGDAGIFGRLEEEVTALRAAHIKYEIIPGVTAASAAAAAVGIPLTRRLVARRVQFITGHDVTGALPDDINWAALADPQATTVVYMGKRTFPPMAQLLISAGLDPATPAMLAHAVSTPDQTVMHTTIAELATHLADNTDTTAALILFGALAEPDD